MDEFRTFSKCKGQKAETFLQEKFGKTMVFDEPFCANVNYLQPTMWLKETLEITRPIVSKSEQSRSAFVISNIILEFYKRSDPNVFVYTEQKLNEGGLTGHLDYILALPSHTSFGEHKYKVVIEVKRAGTGYRNFRRCYGQCMAQMIAMQCFNTKNISKVSNTYGALTNGEIWQFMKLTDNKFYVEKVRYQIDNALKKILGILDAMIRDQL